MILFLGAGIGLLSVPYEQFRSWFPNAPEPAIVKAAGVFVLLCGIVILTALWRGFTQMMERVQPVSERDQIFSP